MAKRQAGPGGDGHMTEQATDMAGAQSRGPVTRVVGAQGSPVAGPPSKPQTRTAPQGESVARERVKVAVRRFNKPLVDLVARDANEGDTRLLVTDFLCEGLGYDKYEDLTTEYQVKGEFADYGVRIDKQLVAFIEVKRCA